MFSQTPLGDRAALPWVTFVGREVRFIFNPFAVLSLIRESLEERFESLLEDIHSQMHLGKMNKPIQEVGGPTVLIPLLAVVKTVLYT